MATTFPIDAVLEDILDQARWAPSGDNTQPWRFEVRGARHVVVHGFDTRSHCVYDLDGHPSQLSLGRAAGKPGAGGQPPWLANGSTAAPGHARAPAHL